METGIAGDLELASTEGIATCLKGNVVKNSMLFEITATSSTVDAASGLAEAAIRAIAAEGSLRRHRRQPTHA